MSLHLEKGVSIQDIYDGKSTLETINVQVARLYRENKITLREAAIKLHECGWLPFIDEEGAKRIIGMS